ncbi:MAG: SEC-C domain-containing protein [Bryobacteraceae bacterium]|nr:SEC-C domain-containing protein [Bryobacteraceae bacterium]
MSAPTDSTLFDTLTPQQTEAVAALAEGLSVTAAAARIGVHRSTVHLWARHHPTFSHALLTARQDRAEHLADSLAGLHQLAFDTVRQILSDENAPAATRLKAALEIVKVVQHQRPTELAQLKVELHDDLAHTANQATTVPAIPKTPVRNAPCPCGSRLKYKRCCGQASSGIPATARAA